VSNTADSTSQIAPSGEHVSTPRTLDVFEAARWFDELWNSTAKAVKADLLAWQCTTWGSGRGHGDWTETALFVLMAEVFGLDTSRNYDGRDELIVSVPLNLVSEITGLIDRIGDFAESWPWLCEEDPHLQVAQAAHVLGRPVSDLEEDADLLEALRIL
jgi:hypothetical protein